jgi:hypothetical protein
MDEDLFMSGFVIDSGVYRDRRAEGTGAVPG